MNADRATGVVTAKVYVTVEAGEVSGVVVDDETIPWGETDWIDDEGKPLSEKDAEEAQAVVDSGDQIWPSWSFGW